jgi:O-antigen ligase
MALWLLWKADSATSLGCLLAGATLLAITTLSRLGRKPAVVHGLVVVFIFIAVFGLIIDTNAGLVTAVGRDTTLTGRTAIWRELFHLNVNSWVGTGFESFWLGGRAEHFWNIYAWHPNQAHNGYIETLINLGWIGVAFLGFLMFWGYRNVIRFLRQDRELGRLRLAFFLVAALYNFTEAAFKVMHPVWIIFLLAIAALPNYSARRAVIHEPGLLLPDRDVLSVAR